MGTYTDLTGQQSGTLIAKTYLGNSLWDCECIVCGNHIQITSYWFNKNIKLNREGCKHTKPVNIGDTFGNLTIITQESDYIKPKSGSHEKRWKCRCTCGRTKTILESNLKAFKSTSCGLCSNRISIPEKAIVYYLINIFPGIEENYRPDFLEGKEIDIYIPELKFGIEYDGEHWHKNIADDITKNKKCNENDICLLRIREPKSVLSEELKPYIVTPKALTNGTHMTEPIKNLIAFINNKYGMSINLDINCLRDNADICKTIHNNSRSNSLAELFPEISKEWDYKKNSPLTPEKVAAHSGKKAHWICPKGHEYSSVIASRTGTDACGCPVCSNRGTALYQNGLYVGEHSLAKETPEIAKDFDVNKNGITADNIAVSSNKKMWWKCHSCGFEWQAKVNNRTSSLKTGCPQCAKLQNKQGNTKRKNLIEKNGSLLDNHPELCEEWDYKKNKISPSEVSSGSQLKTWWICQKGHSFETRISNRTINNTKCPYCTNHKILPGYNDLATTHPILLQEWNFEKNSIQPEEIQAGTDKKVWWKCVYCGKEYESSPENRTKKALGCISCRRKRKK